MNRAAEIIRESFSSTYNVSKLLFKIIIPISIIMKIISDLGLISYLGRFLSPLMSIVGLPGSYGLVWATAICTNLYAAMLVFSKIIINEPVTAAQVTILGMMILVAHGLPIETIVARKSGIRLRVSILIRIGFAVIYGILLNLIFTSFNLFQKAPKIIWYPENRETGISAWALTEIKNYFTIILIIFTLLLIMNILKASGLMKIIIKILKPILKGLGIGENAIPVTIIGTVLGYAYGGGLIIDEAKSGRIGKKDLFYTIIFLSLCHSLIEDSLLMVSIGSDSFTVFLGRFILAYISCTLIVFLTKNMKEDLFLRLFFRPESNNIKTDIESKN